MRIRDVAMVLAFAVAAVSSLPAAAQSCADPTIAPPDPLVDPVDPSPGEDYIWSPGYWDCQDEEQQWVAGGWIHERPGYTWRPHHWAYGPDNHWNLRPGEWQGGGSHAEGEAGRHGSHESGGHAR